MVSFPDRIIRLEAKVAELDRRFRNSRQTGTVQAVDTENGVARVKLAEGDAGDYLTAWIPWKEISAGNITTHIPPSVGQQVDVLSQNGDMTDAVIDFSTHSNANVRPGSSGDAVIKLGATVITISDGTATVKTNFIVDGDLSVTGISTLGGNLAINGDKLTHGGTNVGKDHKHGGVKAGTDTTQSPQ